MFNFVKVFILILTLSFFVPIFANSKSNVTTPNAKNASFLSADTEALLKDIKRLKKDILLKNYNSAILLLTEMVDQLKLSREQTISTFFPDQFNSFEQTSKSSNSYFSAPSLDYGVLFARNYKNKEGHMVDVNVVFEDPSVTEYIKTIQDPKRLKNLGNAQVISINDEYRALEKHSQNEGYLERNIVVHDSLLVNVIATGFTDATIMDAFIETIHLKKLSTYLK